MIVRSLDVAEVAAAVAQLRPGEAASRDVAEVVASILERVRAGGDEAVVEATARLDWPGAAVATLAVTEDEIEAAYADADAALLDALQTTRDNCTFFHEHELIPDWQAVGPQGQILGGRRLPVRRAGLYVPGGLGSYASTVIMNTAPARVAGVEELIICTPPGRDGSVNPSVLTAARLMGVQKVFRVGGAQAIAVMAYGTESIPRVDVICGPGNAYVMEAKRQVYGAVGIDSLAGPSEVLIVADRTARPEWIAADLLAQEEHGSGAQAVVVAESEELCAQVGSALKQLRAGGGTTAAAPSNASGAGVSSAEGGDLLWAFYPAPKEDFLELAAALVNEYAPEHLELQIEAPRDFLIRVKSAGAIFVGHLSATAYGDYIAGSNHVLPTGGSARFASPLSVDTFMRRSSHVEMTTGAVQALTPRLARLADSEGFEYHRVSAEMRSADGAAEPD